MIELISGERQVRTKVEDIRKDHRARYEWVAERVSPGDVLVDAGCGVGYGSKILADAGASVRAYDKSVGAIEFAKQHFNHNPSIEFSVGDLYHNRFPKMSDGVVAFEVIEHLADPGLALRRFREMSDTLYISVPNEDEFPYRNQKFHYRHYTKEQLTNLLAENGWEPVEWWGQEGPESDVEIDVSGRTLVAVCRRSAEDPTVDIHKILHDDAELQRHLINGKVPDSVAIIGMGPSMHTYVDAVTKRGSRWQIANEVWVVNALGGVLAHDRVFHMDDFAIQESRVEAKKSQLVAGILQWAAKHPRLYTSRTYERYPHAIEYPLEWVLNRLDMSPYFKGTPTYAIALALAIGVKEIKLFGLDYHYGNGDIKKREKGRACAEFWLGVAEGRGVKTTVPNTSSLFEQNDGGRERLYGYDTEWVNVESSDRYRVARVPRRPEDIPTAEEISRKYSHDPKVDLKKGSQKMPGSSANRLTPPAALGESKDGDLQ